MRFETLVDEIEIRYKGSPLEIVKQVVNDACEAYVMDEDKKPDSYQLQRLANLILHDDLTNTDSYKTQKEDYPFHSIPQAKRRRKKEFVAMDETLDFMNYKVKANLSTAPPKDNYIN